MKGGRWANGMDISRTSSRTSARLRDNPSVINTLTERKYTYTCAQEYEHLGRSFTLAEVPTSQGRRCYRRLTIVSFITCTRARNVYAYSFPAWSSFDYSTLDAVAVQPFWISINSEKSRDLVELPVSLRSPRRRRAPITTLASSLPTSQRGTRDRM